MNNGRELTPREKTFLREQGFNPEDYLRTRKTADNYEFVNISTGKLIVIRR